MVLPSLAVLTFIGSALPAQAPEDLRFIYGSALIDSSAMADLRALSVEIGPRMTGSHGYERAVAWAAGRFRAHGLTVRLEPVPVSASWRRGPARVRIVAPFEMELAAESVGWSPPTPAPVRGVLRVLSDFAPARVRELGLSLKNSIVLLDFEAAFKDGFPIGRTRVAKVLPVLREVGAKVVLIPLWTNFKGHHHFADDIIAPLPMIDIQSDLAPSLKSMIASGVTIELEARNESVVGKAMTVQNVVAELPGKEAGWILAGAHLDTWDTTPGAQDDGAGVVEVIEAARILGLRAKVSGAPRRTIRFVLWAGEEQFFLGSSAFARAHSADLSSCVAALNADEGAGELRGWSVDGREDLARALAPVAKQLEGIGGAEVLTEFIGNTDTTRFWLQGIPTINLRVTTESYREFHHRPNDTIEKVKPHRLATAAAALAAMTWTLANSEAPIAPKLSPQEVQANIDRLKLRELYP